MNEVLGKRILVTGDSEFLGRHIYRAMRKFGPAAVWCLPHGESHGLSGEGLIALFRESRAEIVIHVCDLNIGLDRQRSKDQAASMDEPELFEAVGEAGIAKCVIVGSSLAYPPVASVPWREVEFCNHPPAGAHSRPVEQQREFLLRGLDAARNGAVPVVTLLTGELYGPGGESQRHVDSLVGRLLGKILEGRESEREQLRMSVSGTQSRDFLFVRDAAEAIALATAMPASGNPVNIGTGIETTLGSLVEMIAAGCDYSGAFAWGQKIMGGVSRQCLDCRRAGIEIGFSSETQLDSGIRETIAWHERHWGRTMAMVP